MSLSSSALFLFSLLFFFFFFSSFSSYFSHHHTQLNVEEFFAWVSNTPQVMEVLYGTFQLRNEVAATTEAAANTLIKESDIRDSSPTVRNFSSFCPILFMILTFDTYYCFQYRLLSVRCQQIDRTHFFELVVQVGSHQIQHHS